MGCAKEMRATAQLVIIEFFLSYCNSRFALLVVSQMIFRFSFSFILAVLSYEQQRAPEELVTALKITVMCFGQ